VTLGKREMKGGEKENEERSGRKPKKLRKEYQSLTEGEGKRKKPNTGKSKKKGLPGTRPAGKGPVGKGRKTARGGKNGNNERF